MTVVEMFSKHAIRQSPNTGAEHGLRRALNSSTRRYGGFLHDCNLAVLETAKTQFEQGRARLRMARQTTSRWQKPESEDYCRCGGEAVGGASSYPNYC